MADADLLSWLTAQLDHDERVAQAAGDQPWIARSGEYGPEVLVGYREAWSREVEYAVWRCEDEEDGCPEIARARLAEGEHIAFHDPARVLRDVAAHRRILQDYESALVSLEAAAGTVLAGATRLQLRLRREAVLAVASIYSDRPGYDPSWTVE